MIAMHTLAQEDNYYMGYDIGGTKCSIVLGGKDFEVHEKIVFPTHTERGYQEIIAEFKRHSYKLFEKYDKNKLVKIGISCGGPLDSDKGIIYSPPNLPGWDSVPIVDIFKEEFGVEVEVQNDANACALAEWMMGAGVGTKNMIFLTFGTGMGAGLILNEKLYTGTNDLGGEVGHMRMAEDGPVGFGKAGSFEGFCSGGGIAQLAKSMISAQLKSGEKVGFCPSEALIGDITASYLGKGLAILIDILNPECIVIGSIYARNEAYLKPLVEKVIENEAIPSASAVCKVLPAALGESIGDFAALCVALN